MIFGCKPQSSVFIFNDVADCFSFQVLFPIICYQVVEIVFGQAGVTDPSEESADPLNVTPAFINSIDRIIGQSGLDIFCMLPILYVAVICIVIDEKSVFGSDP